MKTRYAKKLFSQLFILNNVAAKSGFPFNNSSDVTVSAITPFSSIKGHFYNLKYQLTLIDLMYH